MNYLPEIYILEMWEIGDILNDRWTFVKPQPQENDSEPQIVSRRIKLDERSSTIQEISNLPHFQNIYLFNNITNI